VIKRILEITEYRELMITLAWKEIAVRYKQAYFGIATAVLKPVLLMIIFCIVRSFVGIDTGDIPYPIMTFAALMPWIFFQETTSASINSVVTNVALIRKIYFPREIFPLTAVITKLVELAINFIILAGLMIYYKMLPSIYVVYVPLIIFYTILVSLTVGLSGSAINVYYRDVGQMLPVGLSFIMYASPVIYPLSLVQKKLLLEQAAGQYSNLFYMLYTLNPLVGIIDSFQNVVLKGKPPEISSLGMGLLIVIIAFPISYLIFNRAEGYFADII